MLPVENVAPHQAPRRAIRKSDCLCSREEHFRNHHFGGLSVVSADLINPERYGLVLACVLALDNQQRDAVDEEYDILSRAVSAVVDVKLLGDFVHVTALVARASHIVIVDDVQIKLALLFGAIEFSLITKVRQEIAISVYVGLQAC